MAATDPTARSRAWWIAAGAGLVTVAAVLAGSVEGVLMLAPALLLAAALISGRYLGEETIAPVRRARPAPSARSRARLVATIRPPARMAPRGGLLLAASLATRPPPSR